VFLFRNECRPSVGCVYSDIKLEPSLVWIISVWSSPAGHEEEVLVSEAKINRDLDISSDRARVTIAIPCFKQEAFLFECLNSLITQTMPSWQAFVVDDCSPGATAQRIVSSYTTPASVVFVTRSIVAWPRAEIPVCKQDTHRLCCVLMLTTFSIAISFRQL